jgi:hypothetical protein
MQRLAGSWLGTYEYDQPPGPGPRLVSFRLELFNGPWWRLNGEAGTIQTLAWWVKASCPAGHWADVCGFEKPCFRHRSCTIRNHSHLMSMFRLTTVSALRAIRGTLLHRRPPHRVLV